MGNSFYKMQKIAQLFISFVVINIMQQTSKSPKNAEYFSPWDDDHELTLVADSLATGQPSKEMKKEKSKKNQFTSKNQVEEDGPQDRAKKTLLNMQQFQRRKKKEYLKEYAEIKKFKRQQQNLQPQKVNDLKLPVINNSKKALNVRSSRVREYIKERKSTLENIQSGENQEQQIFKKYGYHKKSVGNVERSISFGSGIVKIQNQINELRKKYQTVDVLEKQLERVELKGLKLTGKKYSYDVRSDRSRRFQSQISYLPTRPNITPHFVLFGHTKEDVLKKVLKQIQHKVKQNI